MGVGEDPIPEITDHRGIPGLWKTLNFRECGMIIINEDQNLSFVINFFIRLIKNVYFYLWFDRKFVPIFFENFGMLIISHKFETE